MGKAKDVFIRPLFKEDIPTITEAFHFIGWHKPACLFEGYLAESRLVWLAFIGDEFSGYITLQWKSLYPSFKGQNIPEIMDLNVLPTFRKMGVGSTLLDGAEKIAATKTDTVGIGVGLYGGKDGGYGSAQRLYIKRDYIPDGKSVTYHYQPQNTRSHLSA